MATSQHKNLTGSDLHEPKAIASAGADRVYLSDGAGSGSWAHLYSAIDLNQNSKIVQVTPTTANLASGGTHTAIGGAEDVQYKVNFIMAYAKTDFDAGGDRLLDLTDGTSVWTSIPAATLKGSAGDIYLWFVDSEVPAPASLDTWRTASVADENIRFEYSGGTTDYSSGEWTFNIFYTRTA